MKSSESSAAVSRPLLGVETQRVAGDRHQRADLALARRLDLLGQAGDRQLAEDLVEAAHARLRQRPNRVPRPRPGSPLVFEAPAAARGNITPPGRSRLPVSTLTTSISQLATVPKDCVVVPIRP